LGQIQWSISRFDLFVDVIGWTLHADDRERFQCRGKGRVTHENPALTGFEFGGRTAPIFARVYDKTVEIAGNGKTWWHEIWGPRWSGEQVWRFEAQINREGLRQFGVESPESALALSGGIWGGVTDKWITYRVPTSDSNRSRWPLALEWPTIQNATLRGNHSLVELVETKKGPGLVPGPFALPEQVEANRGRSWNARSPRRRGEPASPDEPSARHIRQHWEQA
jgi:hypothetical protein